MQLDNISEITPEILSLAKKCEQVNQIDSELYTKYEVKRGLRDLNGKGVLTGLTDISEICSYKEAFIESAPIPSCIF